ncbi:MAG: hypothetical protein AB7S88_03370 [Candidatus Izemoplasmatales bacterium]
MNKITDLWSSFQRALVTAVKERKSFFFYVVFLTAIDFLFFIAMFIPFMAGPFIDNATLARLSFGWFLVVVSLVFWLLRFVLRIMEYAKLDKMLNLIQIIFVTGTFLFMILVFFVLKADVVGGATSAFGLWLVLLLTALYWFRHIKPEIARSLIMRPFGPTDGPSASVVNPEFPVEPEINDEPVKVDPVEAEQVQETAAPEPVSEVHEVPVEEVTPIAPEVMEEPVEEVVAEETEKKE